MTNQRAIDSLMLDVLNGRSSRRTLLRRAAILGITGPTLAALIAACGDDEDDGDTDTTDPATDTDEEATEDDAASDSDEEATEEATEESDEDATEEPADEGDDDEQATGDSEEQIVILQGVDANNLDPLLRNSTPEFTINMHVFDMMTKRDPDTLEVQGNIVEDWEIIDETTWEFKLVEGATFHNGDPVNAEAAVFTFERAAQDTIGDSGRVQALAGLIEYQSAEVVDEYTFRVLTGKPAAIFPDLLTSFEICPPAWYEDDSSENISKVAQEPMGSGPYKFVEWVRDDHITLEVNEDYWGDVPSFREIIVRPVPELSGRVIALQNEEAHIIVNVAPDVVPQIEEAENTRISDVIGGRSIFMGIRCDVEPFDDVRVRQALNYGVDWDPIKDALLEGYGEKMRTIVNPPNDAPDIEAYPYDPERARSLLDEAGVPEGFEVVMDAPNGRYIKDSELAQAIAQGYQEIGINIDLNVLDWSIYAGELLPSGEPDPLFFLGLGSPFSGEQELFYVHPDYSLNYTRWQDQDYIDKFAQLSSSVDPDERTELMNELQHIVREGCPWVFLWKQVDFYGVAANLDWEARADERIWVAESSFSTI